MDRPRLLIVADDLTGALDAAAPFAARGLATVVARHPGAVAGLPAGAEVVAVSTASREGSVGAALSAVAEVVAAGLRPAQVFKKVDSRLKGHVGAETAALARAFGYETALACPAVPQLGRTVEGGAVVGAGVDRPIPVAAAFDGHGLKVAVRDAPTQDALAAIAAETGDTDELMIGAAGLALALAESMTGTAARTPAYDAPLLFAIGSRDPVTTAQVARLLARLGDTGAPASLMRQPADGGTGPRESGARFAADVAAAIAATAPATLLACGGETANAILAALRIDTLTVSGEALPGVPLAQAGAFTLLTKSGGFGGPDLLADVLRNVWVSRHPACAGATAQGPAPE